MGTSSFHNICFDRADQRRVACFWADALEYAVHANGLEYAVRANGEA